MIIEKKKISDLKPAPYNPRKSNEKQEANLKKSLEKFGVVEPIVFNKQTGHIVGGHFRIRELKKLGYKEVDCVIVDLNEDDEKELNIRLNANTGEWDWDTLANEWNVEELSEWGIDIPETLETLERINSNDAEFEAEINKYSDKNCQLPIVKEFFETHECFLIPIHNEIDEKFIREVFCLNENYISDCGDGKIRKTNVIDIQKIKSCLLK